MTKYPTTPQSLVSLVITTLKAYPTIFAQTWLLVAFSAAVHLVVPWFFVINPAFGGVAFIGFVLFTWFLYIVILTRANIALQGGHMKDEAAFKIARKRYLAVLGSNLIFFGIGAFLFLFEFTLEQLTNLLTQHPFYLIISVIIDLYIFIMLYFAIPIIVLEHKRVYPAFIGSIQLVRHHWWRTFIVLGLLGAAILGVEALGILFTGQARMFLFTGYHFLLQFVFYPLIVAATLILLHDLKLRLHLKEAETTPTAASHP
ncbi:MAG TPA: hypothetical protein VHE99_03590 [Gammaproteobacteria bacterium]|nr:hypothetical protein [Gammaproteobacteria bacterium]